VLKIEGNFPHLRAKPAHFVGNLPKLPGEETGKEKGEVEKQ
jgi:hypothetical protein